MRIARPGVDYDVRIERLEILSDTAQVKPRSDP